MPPIDLKTQYKNLYKPSPEIFSVVFVPMFKFLMIDGSGDPNESSEYSKCVDTLFSTAYILKFKLKAQTPSLDYVVMPLESLWWAEDMSAFPEGERSQWQWTVMIMVPESVTEQQFEESRKEAKERKKMLPFDRMRLSAFEEGNAIQTMHHGPYSEETELLQRMSTAMRELGLKPAGNHHEIYLNDPRTTAPDKLRTVLRHAVE